MVEKSLLMGKSIPLNVVEPEPVYILLDITPVFGYDSNGTKTDVVIGFLYTVVNTNSFNQYRVKVLQPAPLIERDKLHVLRESGKKFLVEFENSTVRMYWNTRSQEYSDTFKADGIQQVEEEINLE